MSSYCQLESLTHSSLATVVVVSVFYCQDSKGEFRLAVTITNYNNAKKYFKYICFVAPLTSIVEKVNGAPELLCFPHSSGYLPSCSAE